MLLIASLVPLAMAPGLVSAFDITPKLAILLFGVSVQLLFCKQLVNGFQALSQSTIGRPFLALLAAGWLSTAASTFWSTNRALSIAGSSWRRDGLVAESAILLFAVIAASWFAGDRRRIQLILRASSATGAVASLYGIAQYFGFDPFLPTAAYHAGEGIFTIVRPPGTFGHADYFANWLLIVVFFALALSRMEENRAWRTLATLTILLASFAIVFSGTRSAMIGLLAGALVFLAIARPRANRKTLALLLAALACLAILYVSPSGAKLRARVHWSLDDLRGGARLLLWKDSLHMALQHPFLGYGPETFTAQFPPFESVALARAYPDFYQESPHNMFLDALASRGIPGTILLLALCALPLWASRKDAALAAALAGSFVCQQFLVLTIPTALYFYLLLAIIAQKGLPTQSQGAAIPRANVPRRVAGGQSGLSLPLLALASSMVFLFYAARFTVADRAMALAEHRIATADVSGAAAAYRIVQRWEPATDASDLRYSRAMTHLASTTPDFRTSVAAAQQAVESAVRATRTAEDRQNAWYNLATIAALRNDPASVESALRQSIACAPNWFKPHWTLSQLLELSGRHAEARREATLALDLDGGRDPEVAATWQRILSRP